jgi:hypothetical protein
MREKNCPVLRLGSCHGVDPQQEAGPNPDLIDGIQYGDCAGYVRVFARDGPR